MPAMIRLATIAGARYCRIARSTWALLSCDLLERVRQQIDVEIEQLDVVGRLLDAPNRRRHHQHLAARRVDDRLRRLQVEVRLDDDELDALTLHFADELDGVRRGRWNAGLRLDIPHHIETEALHEVRPGPMIGHDLR